MGARVDHYIPTRVNAAGQDHWRQTYRRIIFFSLHDARSIEVSARCSYKRHQSQPARHSNAEIEVNNFQDTHRIPRVLDLLALPS